MELNVTNLTSTMSTILATTTRKRSRLALSNNDVEAARITVYISIIIVAFLGNSMLILTIILTRRMRTRTNYFLLNMAIGDLLVAVICAPYQLASWEYPFIKTFNQRICKSMPFIQMSTVGVSIFTMLAMAVDRYRAVLHPLRKRMTKKLTILVIFGVWAATFIITSPMIFVYQVKTIKIPDGGPNGTSIKICGEFGWKNPERDGAAFTYSLFTFYYAMPGLMMGYLYLRIFLNLWFHNFPGSHLMSKANLQILRKKHYRRKKTVVMLLSLFLTFMLCNLPMHVMSFIFYVMGPKFKPPPYMSLVTMGSEMAMYSNSALNPILYGFLHDKFKACAKGILKWLLCGGRRPSYDVMPVYRTKKKISTGATLIWSSDKGERSKIHDESKF